MKVIQAEIEHAGKPSDGQEARRWYATAFQTAHRVERYVRCAGDLGS
jgi:hypothetical protein